MPPKRKKEKNKNENIQIIFILQICQNKIVWWAFSTGFKNGKIYSQKVVTVFRAIV